MKNSRHSIRFSTTHPLPLTSTCFLARYSNFGHRNSFLATFEKIKNLALATVPDKRRLGDINTWLCQGRSWPPNRYCWKLQLLSDDDVEIGENGRLQDAS
ncbi:hypothetical protein AVEN_142877-1 [Araneus ventricosus]|uniref:Uncharacterized protein n=1 Tax=Araneus ventricosus TaxID=182803 RepID=A0A4Y2MXS4_ARAVE|nr:hypothetical protein AVEN_142877-1 [Araneus ventricosus]